MNANQLIKYKREWEELETLIARSRKSIYRLSPDELSRLDILYRRTSASLAQVSTRTTDQRLIHYLNNLTAAAHSIIYLPPRKSFLKNIPEFFATGFPKSVARLWKYHLASLLLLVLGAVIAYWSVKGNLQAAYALLPAGEVRQPGASREQLLQILRSGRDQAHGTKFVFASFLFQNNLKVAIMAMVCGILAAIPTVFIIIYNGMILGAFTAVHYQAGITWELWAWILPHGITELSAIVLCGGAGLKIGQALLSPGMLARTESLRLAGEEAARTVGGVAFMLCIAAIIESYVRQSNLSQSARFLFAAASFTIWGLYFFSGFRLRKSNS